MRYCFALDLKNDEVLIKEYEAWHQKVWPEIIAGLRQSGIENLEIYRIENRLFMVMDVNETFSLKKKAAMDNASIIAQEWEQLMWHYQQALPTAKPDEKWMLMEKIFQL